MNSAPAQTRHSLLASATRRAALDGGQRRLEPAAPVIAADHPVGRTARGFGDRLRPGRRLDAAARERGFELAIGFRIGDRREIRAPNSRASLASAAALPVGRHRLDRESGRAWRFSRSTVLVPIDPVAPRIVTVRRAARVGLRLARLGGVRHHSGSPDQQSLRRGAEPAARASPPWPPRARLPKTRRAGPSARHGRE